MPKLIGLIGLIDWMTEFKDDFKFIRLDARRVEQAKDEVVRKAVIVADREKGAEGFGGHPLSKVYCLRILEVKGRGRNRKVVDSGFRFSAYWCSWSFEEDFVRKGDAWDFVDPDEAVTVDEARGVVVDGHSEGVR